MFKAVKRFAEWLYKKTWPNWVVCPEETYKNILERAWKYDKLTDPTSNPFPRAQETRLTERTLNAVRLFSSEEYETYKHNPSFMEFVKEDLIRSFLPEISKRVEIRTDYNPCYKTARIEGRLTFWEEIK